VRVECAEKTGVPGFGFSRRDEIAAWASPRRFREKELYCGGSKERGWVYTVAKPGGKMEILAETYVMLAPGGPFAATARRILSELR